MRYLGIGLGMAIALSYCTAFGTLVPPIAGGKFGELIGTNYGIATLVGIVISLVGIVVTGAAGVLLPPLLVGESGQSAS
jgi:L-rhamnose-H+ transport protein